MNRKVNSSRYQSSWAGEVAPWWVPRSQPARACSTAGRWVRTGARSVGEAQLGQRPPPLQADGPDQGARLHHPAGEGGQAAGGRRRQPLHPHPPRRLPPVLEGDGRHHPARGAGRAGPAEGGQGAELDPALEAGPARADHGPAEAVQHRPGRLVAAEVQRPGQLAGRHPLLGRCHQPGGREPGAQRRARPLEQGPGGHGGLVPAGPADQTLARSPPRRPVLAAVGAEEPVGPAEPLQVAEAGGLVGEEGQELVPVRRVVAPRDRPVRGRQGVHGRAQSPASSSDRRGHVQANRPIVPAPVARLRSSSTRPRWLANQTPCWRL